MRHKKNAPMSRKGYSGQGPRGWCMCGMYVAVDDKMGAILSGYRRVSTRIRPADDVFAVREVLAHAGGRLKRFTTRVASPL